MTGLRRSGIKIEEQELEISNKWNSSFEEKAFPGRPTRPTRATESNERLTENFGEREVKSNLGGEKA